MVTEWNGITSVVVEYVFLSQEPLLINRKHMRCTSTNHQEDWPRGKYSDMYILIWRLMTRYLLNLTPAPYTWSMSLFCPFFKDTKYQQEHDMGHEESSGEEESVDWEEDV